MTSQARQMSQMSIEIDGIYTFRDIDKTTTSVFHFETHENKLLSNSLKCVLNLIKVNLSLLSLVARHGITFSKHMTNQTR